MFYKSVSRQQAEYYTSIAACQHKLSCPKKEHIRRYLRSKLAQITILVIRTTNDAQNNNLGCSKPCKECLTHMKQFGIKHVIYSSGKDKELIYEHTDYIDAKYSSLHRFMQKNNLDVIRCIKWYY